jgi:pimeloyl-[acyl-carrier protein] methyl ester esterase
MTAPSSNKARVLLLPGLDGTGELFAPLYDILHHAVATSIVRYESERSFEEYVGTAARTMPASDTVLVAESFSGPVALALAARYPVRIRCLVLCATFAQSPFRSMLRGAKFVPSSMLQPNPMQRLLLQHLCLNGERSASLLEQTVSVLRSVPATTMHARLATLASIDVRPVLQKVTVPVLYLQASRDRIVSPRLGRALTSKLSNVSIRQVEGPHLLLQARPHDCAEAILQFLGHPHVDRPLPR